MKDIVIIGAGIVGLSAAMQLKMDGHEITIVDPHDPASGCSSGNAGYLSQANVFPPISTESLLKLPQLLMDPDGPLVIRPEYLLRFLPWGIQAALRTRPKKLREITDAMAALILPAIDSYEPLLQAAGAEHLLDKRGALVVCRTEGALQTRATRIPALRAYGIAAERLQPGSVAELEPNVTREIVGGIYYPNSARCLDPRGLGVHFSRHLIANGAELVRSQVRKLDRMEDGTWLLTADNEIMRARRVVVSAGCWSGALLKPLGFRVPLEAERGYHLMLPHSGVILGRPVSMAEAHFVATPMLDGLRLAGTVEFAGLDAPMNPARATMLFRLAAPFLPGLSDRDANPWMGHRPSFPDGLPAIGRANAHPNLFYCFGHSHNGLMLGATSGKLLADIVAGRKPAIDPRPYRLERFSLSPFKHAAGLETLS